MSRPVDLEKVKRAWKLRRQGKQQKDIAETLDFSLRHVQNYLSLDWLAQRVLRVLEKGRAEEANNQLILLWDLGETQLHGETDQADPRIEAPPVTGEAAEPEGSTVCRAPEHWPDVAQLDAWGVPQYDAPGLLGAWRRAHREGTHQLCTLWGDLVESVRAGIPFPDAYDLVISIWLAERWGFGLLKDITELYRLYRPWEERVNRQVYLEEVRSAIVEHEGNGSKLDETGVLLEELPRRFLHGLPRGSERRFEKFEEAPRQEPYGLSRGSSRIRFERFSEAAGRVLSLAQDEVHGFNHASIGPEHILLGLARETEGVGARVLANLGVDLTMVRPTVESKLARGERPSSGEIGMSSSAKKVAKLAVKEARRMNRTHADTEDLLTGLLREEEGVGADVLKSLGVTLEKVRLEIQRILSQGPEENIDQTVHEVGSS